MEHTDKIAAFDGQGACVASNHGAKEDVNAHGYYTVECRGADGELIWSEKLFPNLVTTGGKNDLLDKYLSGSGYTATFYLGLISATGYTTGPDAADTMASHAGWAEDQNYSEATRQAAAWGAASGGSKVFSSALNYSMNATTTIKGCFLTTVATKGGTTGILYSAGLFTGGDQPAVNGNTLNVTYTAGA